MSTACEIQGMIETLKELFKALDGEDWKRKCITGMFEDPKMCLYSCCCGCVLQGQISQKQGRNCLASCLMTCCCPLCALAGFAVPDRKQVGKSKSILEDCVVMSACSGICGRIQLAAELGIGVPEDTNALKESAKQGADALKSEVQSPAPAPTQVPAQGSPPASNTMSR